MSELKDYSVTVSFLTTSRWSADVGVRARGPKHAARLAMEKVNACGGNDTEEIKWEEDFLGGDGDYEVDDVIEIKDETKSVPGEEGPEAG